MASYHETQKKYANDIEDIFEMTSPHQPQKKYANDIKEIFEALEPFRGDPHVEHGVQDFLERIENNCPRLKTLRDQRDCIGFVYQLAMTRKLIAENPEKYKNPNKDKPLSEEAI